MADDLIRTSESLEAAALPNVPQPNRFKWMFFLKKNMDQSRPLFCLFSSFSHHKSITNWKKRRWSAWDSNPGPQNGRRRRNHRAMAATPLNECLLFRRLASVWPDWAIFKVPGSYPKYLSILGFKNCCFFGKHIFSMNL